jgi:hypothetical protein
MIIHALNVTQNGIVGIAGGSWYSSRQKNAKRKKSNYAFSE